MKEVGAVILTLIIVSTLCVAFNMAPVITAETTEAYPFLYSWFLVDDVGTYFEVTNSTYLNVTLASSEIVHIVLESKPRMVSFAIDSNASATSTVLTLGGLEAEKTYYRYEDGDLVESFTTDLEGWYTYLQDISDWHRVFIREVESTIYIRCDGSVDPASAPIAVDGNVYTFTADIEQSLVVQKDYVVIDGNGYSIRGPEPWTDIGIYLKARTGVTIRNTIVEDWGWNGIRLDYWSNNNEIRGNTFLRNGFEAGSTIMLYAGPYNNLVTTNTFQYNYIGVALARAEYNTFSDNYFSSNVWPIGLHLYADHNNVTRNIMTKNKYGILMMAADYNSISDNVFFNNGYGFWMYSTQGNTIYHNDIVLNDVQAWDSWAGLNHWHHPDLLEGNYWSDYPGVDDGSGTDKHEIAGDGIGDTNIPWPGPDYDYYPFVSPFHELPAIISGTVTVSCFGSPVADVEIDLYNEVGEFITSTTTADDGTYSWVDLTPGDYWITVVPSAVYTIPAGEESVPVTVMAGEKAIANFVLEFRLVGDGIAPRTIGYWKHQVNAWLTGKGKPHETEEDMLLWFGTIGGMSTQFAGITSLEEAQVILNIGKGASMEDRAKQQLLALWLNVVSGKVATHATIDLTDFGLQGITPVSEAIQYCEDNLTANPELVKDIADAINNGEVFVN